MASSFLLGYGGRWTYTPINFHDQPCRHDGVPILKAVTRPSPLSAVPRTSPLSYVPTLSLFEVSHGRRFRNAKRDFSRHLQPSSFGSDGGSFLFISGVLVTSLSAGGVRANPTAHFSFLAYLFQALSLASLDSAYFQPPSSAEAKWDLPGPLIPGLQVRS